MCKVLNIQKSSYYQWLKWKPSERAKENYKIESEVIDVYNTSKKRYGSPKITQELTERGYIISRPRVARIMKKNGLRSIVNRKYRIQTTDSTHSYNVSENLLNREFTSSQPSQAWVSDITYIPTLQGWLYLTVIIDLFDRKVIGWSLSDNMTAQSTIMAAWDMSLKNRDPEEGMMFHSDRGVQYASHKFRNILKKHKVIQSMSRKGNCWDNAVAECFFKILKSEMVYHETFNSLLHAKVKVFEFIEVWYNRKRKHSHLDYKSPDEFYLSKYLNVA